MNSSTANYLPNVRTVTFFRISAKSNIKKDSLLGTVNSGNETQRDRIEMENSVEKRVWRVALAGEFKCSQAGGSRQRGKPSEIVKWL